MLCPSSLSTTMITTCITDSSRYAIKNTLCNMFVVIIYSLLMFAFCVVNAKETDDSLCILSLKFTSVFLSQCRICRKITNISRYRFVFPKRFCTLQLSQYLRADILYYYAQQAFYPTRIKLASRNKVSREITIQLNNYAIKVSSKLYYCVFLAIFSRKTSRRVFVTVHKRNKR